MKCMQVLSDLVKLSLFLMCVLCITNMFCVGGKVQRIHPLYNTLYQNIFGVQIPIGGQKNLQ